MRSEKGVLIDADSGPLRLGMYFDAAVVFVTNFYSDLVWPYCG